jgi:hypothetical protein
MNVDDVFRGGSTSLLVPFTTNDPKRIRVWKWIRETYERAMPDIEICIGRCTDVPFNRSRAINNAAIRATRPVWITNDADCLLDPLGIKLASVAVLGSPEKWFMPFTNLYMATQKRTLELLESPHEFPADIGHDEFYDLLRVPEVPQFTCGIGAMHRDVFNDVGGMDERFKGYGCEDLAFQTSLLTLHGRYEIVPTPAIGLWHPKIRRADGGYLWPGQKNYAVSGNQTLHSRYRTAMSKPAEMRALLAERDVSVD